MDFSESAEKEGLEKCCTGNRGKLFAHSSICAFPFSGLRLMTLPANSTFFSSVVCVQCSTVSCRFLSGSLCRMALSPP